MDKLTCTAAELKRLKDAGVVIDIGYSLVWDTRSLNWVSVELSDRSDTSA
jgi:hypothetical protein